MSVATVGDTATLAHGYTMAEVEKFTRIAINRAWGAGALDATDRWDYAWHAVIELLYRRTTRPTSRELIQAAGNAVTEARADQFHHHGINVTTAEPAPWFVKYWRVGDLSDGFTERLVENIALTQVLSLLTDDQYEALAALSVYGNVRDSAISLRVSETTFSSRVQNARAKIMRAWLEPDTPRTFPRRGDMPICTRGHARAEFGRINEQGKWHCSRCGRNRSRLTLARRRARGDGQLASVDAPVAPPLSFAPEHDGSPDCWCGLRYGHGWPGKDRGAPHPRNAG